MSRDDGDPTAVTTDPGAETEQADTLVPMQGASASIVLPEAGYVLGGVVGRGGMGEVFTAHDQRIDRDVAVKRMRQAVVSDSATARFLREARIQARLDHPAIVPVHELGVDAEGRPYFTMKLLGGVTLSQRIAEPGPLQPLLRAFVDVCLALEFAHARGVIHRDLKPANIMLGDYGEVYVLDWGIAKVLKDRGRASSHGDIDTLDEGTRAGDLLGTPGYMAPEQARGELVGPAADVYSLGSILFEILTGEPLHPRGMEALASTLSSPQQAPARRTPDREIAPELDAACQAALAASASARPSARELAARVQRYLDGDRDVERRHALASEQLGLAREALRSGDPEARAKAMHCAGRALALHPESAEAARLVTSLIVEPPRVLPKELVAGLAEQDRRSGNDRLRVSLSTLFVLLSPVLLLPLMELRNGVTLGIVLACFATVLILLWGSLRRGGATPGASLLAALVLAMAFSRVLGPYVLMPVVVGGSLLALTANPWIAARPLVIAAWLLTVAVAPQALEWAGVFAPTWWMIDGGVCAQSAILKGTSQLDALELVITNFLLLGTVAVYAVRVSRSATDARHKLYIQAWHLGQLLPSGQT